MELDAFGTRVLALAGDLTQQEVDAIVNAANAHLQHGGGVAGAIARAGGPDIQRESDEWVGEHGHLEDGVAAVTSSGSLPARHVVHVAGPVYDPERDDNADRLGLAVHAALDAAVDAGARSVAFPAISAGIYGYPQDEAAFVITREVLGWLALHQGALDEVRLVGFDDAAAAAFAAGLRAMGD